jgi:hypothetical protein
VSDIFFSILEKILCYGFFFMYQYSVLASPEIPDARYFGKSIETKQLLWIVYFQFNIKMPHNNVYVRNVQKLAKPCKYANLEWSNQNWYWYNYWWKAIVFAENYWRKKSRLCKRQLVISKSEKITEKHIKTIDMTLSPWICSTSEFRGKDLY